MGLGAKFCRPLRLRGKVAKEQVGGIGRPASAIDYSSSRVYIIIEREGERERGQEREIIYI